jgi:hypothetical protein
MIGDGEKVERLMQLIDASGGSTQRRSLANL